MITYFQMLFQASQRKPVVSDQSDVLRITPDTPQFDPHIWTQDSINIAVSFIIFSFFSICLHV